MGLYKWTKDWDRGWIIVSATDRDWQSSFYLPDDDVAESQNDYQKLEQLKREHPVPFTEEMKNDLKDFHGIE